MMVLEVCNDYHIQFDEIVQLLSLSPPDTRCSMLTMWCFMVKIHLILMPTYKHTKISRNHLSMHW